MASIRGAVATIVPRSSQGQADFDALTCRQASAVTNFVFESQRAVDVRIDCAPTADIICCLHHIRKIRVNPYILSNV